MELSPEVLALCDPRVGAQFSVDGRRCVPFVCEGRTWLIRERDADDERCAHMAQLLLPMVRRALSEREAAEPGRHAQASQPVYRQEGRALVLQLARIKWDSAEGRRILLATQQRRANERAARAAGQVGRGRPAFEDELDQNSDLASLDSDVEARAAWLATTDQLLWERAGYGDRDYDSVTGRSVDEERADDEAQDAADAAAEADAAYDEVGGPQAR